MWIEVPANGSRFLLFPVFVVSTEIPAFSKDPHLYSIGSGVFFFKSEAPRKLHNYVSVKEHF